MTLLLIDWMTCPILDTAVKYEDARICAYAVCGPEPEFSMLCYLVYICRCYIDHETAWACALYAICRGQTLASCHRQSRLGHYADIIGTGPENEFGMLCYPK